MGCPVCTLDQLATNASFGCGELKIMSNCHWRFAAMAIDYILIDESLRDFSFVTSFNNFISDHKSIIARVGLDKNEFTKEF